MQSQQRLPLSPQGALKLAWPISVVSCWRKGGGGKSKAGELLSSVSIQSLDVGYLEVGNRNNFPGRPSLGGLL